MPSQAFRAFKQSCSDIDRLLELHKDLGGTSPGRRYGLEVLNKSAVVLITAFWEAYCEDVAAEGLQHLVTHADSASRLPDALRKVVARELEKDPHELATWRIADDGWRQVLQDRLEILRDERNRSMNTPKAVSIDDLFKKAIGLDNVSTSWSVGTMTPRRAAAELDRFVTLRGEIAHRGKAVRSVRKKDVVEYYELVKQIASKTGGRVNARVKLATGTSLW